MSRNRHHSDELFAWLLLAGVPSVLLLRTGNPLSLFAQLSRANSLIALLAWVVWAWCGLDLIASTLRQLKRRELLADAPRALDRMAARLAGLALVIASLLPGFGAAAGAAPPSTAPSLHANTQQAVTVIQATASTYLVVPGDSLWSIAAAHYGDPLDWTLIARANLGRTMTDGRLFTDPSLIFAGWLLTLPDQAARTSASLPPIAKQPDLLALHASAPRAQVAPSGSASTQSSRLHTPSTHHPQAHRWWLPATLSSSMLLLGLLARRRRSGNRVLPSDPLIDASALLDELPLEPLISMVERAVLLAWRDGVLTQACVMSIGPEGARIETQASHHWSAAPADLAVACEAPTASPGFVMPLREGEGRSELLIVPAGVTATISGAQAEAMVAEALTLQRDYLWGMWNWIEGSEDAPDSDHVIISTRFDAPDSAACIVVVDGGDDADFAIDDSWSLDDPDWKSPSMPAILGPLGRDLLDAPAQGVVISASLARLDSVAPRTTCDPMLRLLVSEPRIDGLQGVLERSRQRRVVELLAYLCLHRDDPPTADRLRTRVLGTTERDAAAKTLFNIASAARKALGNTSEDEPYLAPVTRDGRYVVANSLQCDMERFFALVGTTTHHGHARLDELTQAFDLIEAEPLGATLSGYGWMSAEGIRSQLEIATERAASEAVSLALELGLANRASIILAKAQVVATYSESLCMLAMDIAAAQRDPRGLRSAFDALARVCDQLDPGTSPNADQEQHYRRLVARINDDQASLAAMEAAPRSTRPSAPAAL
jgi:DNA-binding SARP family transcriptional activator